MMNRYDRYAERQWIELVSERNERARRIKAMRKARVPRTDHEETAYILLLVGVLNVLALVGLIVWTVI